MHDRLVYRRTDALHQCFLVCICPRFQGSVIFSSMNNRKSRLLPSKAIDTTTVYIHTATGCIRCEQLADGGVTSGCCHGVRI